MLCMLVIPLVRSFQALKLFEFSLCFFIINQLVVVPVYKGVRTQGEQQDREGCEENCYSFHCANIISVHPN